MTELLSTNVAAFCSVLRSEHQFSLGRAEIHEALRAVETIGLTDEARMRSALRLVCCGTHDQTLVFDRAFDAFFHEPRGVAQPHNAARHTRPGAEAGRQRDPRHRSQTAEADDDGSTLVPSVSTGSPAGDEPPRAAAWQTLRARSSAADGAAEPPRLDAGHHRAMLDAASRLVASVRLGRSRRWSPTNHGGRFDVRRTLRTSLQTGGEPLVLRLLGHPLRNPRFVVLIDGSRSMVEHAGAVIQFARALSERSARTSVFFFSTELREGTRQLRAVNVDGGRLDGLGPAWGGGTKIGASLDTFVAVHGARLLSPQTVVLIFSDGLDAGDLPQLERAMRTIDRRCAAVVWLNPLADTPGYEPTARGMRTARPFIDILTAARDAPGFAKLAQRLGQLPRLGGNRR